MTDDYWLPNMDSSRTCIREEAVNSRLAAVTQQIILLLAKSLEFIYRDFGIFKDFPQNALP